MPRSNVGDASVMTKKTSDHLTDQASFLRTVWAGQTFYSITVDTLETANSCVLNGNNMSVPIADHNPPVDRTGRKLGGVRERAQVPRSACKWQGTRWNPGVSEAPLTAPLDLIPRGSGH